MSLRINDEIPNLTVNTDHGEIKLHDYIGDNWGILFSHPKDFTPVCTTEFSAVAKLNDVTANSHWSTIGAKRYRSSRMVAGSGIEPLTSGL